MNTQHVSNAKMIENTFCWVDIAKFFFSICIVLLHTSAIDFIGEVPSFYVTRIVFRMAVPFFFVCSGFFLATKIWDNRENMKGAIRKYVIRLGIWILVFESINLFLEVIEYIYKGTFDFEAIIEIIKHVLFYPYGALWYLQASLIGVILLYPFLKRKKETVALICGIILYVWALICNNYYFVVENTSINVVVEGYMDIFISARNGLFVGFIFLLIGIITYPFYKYAKEKINMTYHAMALIICVILYCFEIYCLFDKSYLDDGALYIMQLLLIPVLLTWLLRLKCEIDISKSLKLRNLSTGIYLLHRPIIMIIKGGAKILNINLPNLLLALFVIFFSITICLWSYKFKNKTISNFLK
ncbi:MAG: acyltransferase [Alphaproteobacteria bacterium]|nr:acyltransferase [Alphaproteobacteria bacterium]